MSNHLFFLGKALEGLTTGFAVGLQERQKIQAEVEQQKLKTRQTEVTEAAKTAREETKEAGRLATEEQKTLREESRRQQLQEKFEKQFGVQLEQVRQSGLRAEAAAEAAKLKAQQTQGELSEQFAIGAKRNLSAISLRNDREGLIQYLNFFQNSLQEIQGQNGSDSREDHATTVLNSLTIVRSDTPIKSSQEAIPPQLKETTMQQVLDKAVWMSQKGITELKIVLKPEHLGTVLVQITHEQNGLSARIGAQDSAMGDLLKSQLGSLKTSLAQEGVHLQNITVFVGGHFNPDSRSFKPEPWAEPDGGPSRSFVQAMTEPFLDYEYKDHRLVNLLV